MPVPELVNDPDLGLVTFGCDSCADLRARLHAAREGEPHPVTVVTIFSEKLKHEEETGHVTFGWQFTLKVRKLADEFIALNNELSPFWKDFRVKYLLVPVTSGDGRGV